MAYAARPKRRRDDFFANVEILRGLRWASAETSAVDKQSFSIRSDHEQ
jgi:hypothetical protein